MTTRMEQVGDWIYGAHVVVCNYDTDSKNRCLLPTLHAGRGGLHTFSFTEHADGGWSRKAEVTVDTRSVDPSRATTVFRVVSVEHLKAVPSGYNEGMGGGTQIVIERVSAPHERITYDRGGCWRHTVTEPTRFFEKEVT